MFRNFSVKLILVALLAITMTACASISGNTLGSTNHSRVNAFVPPVIQPLQTEVEQVVLKMPEPKVREFTIPGPSGYLSDKARIVMSDAEITCMARVMYFEARGEGTLGMTAVGYVVMNRMGSPGFKPTTVCGIVNSQNRRGCQFSWVCDGKADRIHSPQLYERARQVAVNVMTHSVPNPVRNSVYFRSSTARSRYAASQRHIASIGGHRFFVDL